MSPSMLISVPKGRETSPEPGQRLSGYGTFRQHWPAALTDGAAEAHVDRVEQDLPKLATGVVAYADHTLPEDWIGGEGTAAATGPGV